MGEERRKQSWIFPYTGEKLPIAGSKPLSQIKKDIKFSKLVHGLKLLALLLFLLFVLARDLLPYWLSQLKVLFSST